MEKTIICTNRLQPLHLGHLHFWIELKKKYPDNHLIICILRRSRFIKNLHPEISTPETYEELSRSAFALGRNPLPNWERLKLVSIAVDNEPLLSTNTTVMLRTRPDVSWEASVEDLPDNRIWAFNTSAEPSFNTVKIDFYKGKGEEVLEFDIGRYGGYDGDVIRKLLRSGNKDLSFLPPACRDYFRDNCLGYFSS